MASPVMERTTSSFPRTTPAASSKVRYTKLGQQKTPCKTSAIRLWNGRCFAHVWRVCRAPSFSCFALRFRLYWRIPHDEYRFKSSAPNCVSLVAAQHVPEPAPRTHSKLSWGPDHHIQRYLPSQSERANEHCTESLRDGHDY